MCCWSVRTLNTIAERERGRGIGSVCVFLFYIFNRPGTWSWHWAWVHRVFVLKTKYFFFKQKLAVIFSWIKIYLFLPQSILDDDDYLIEFCFIFLLWLNLFPFHYRISASFGWVYFRPRVVSRFLFSCQMIFANVCKFQLSIAFSFPSTGKQSQNKNRFPPKSLFLNRPWWYLKIFISPQLFRLINFFFVFLFCVFVFVSLPELRLPANHHRWRKKSTKLDSPSQKIQKNSFGFFFSSWQRSWQIKVP